MKVLVLGSSGQVGEALMSRLQLPAMELVGLCRSNVGANLLNPTELEALLVDNSPDVIINASAYTKVDEAESHFQEAWLVNVRAVEILAGYAKKTGALLIHFGTDYVFDGSGSQPWTEKDKPNPLNVYGKSKLEGERVIQQSGCRYVIIRLSWVHSPKHNNFVTNLLRWVKERTDFSIVTDQWGTPTSAFDVADAVGRVIERSMTDKTIGGIYHFANEGYTNRFECARFIVEQLGCQCTLHPVESSHFELPAKRPLNCRMNSQKFSSAFDFKARSWQDGVKETVEASI